MEDFEQDVPFKESLTPASLYVSARVESAEVSGVPSRIHTDGGAELTVTGEVASAEHAPARTRTYSAVLSVPRGRLVKFPARVPVEVEVYPASPTSVEVGIRPLESISKIGNADRYGVAANDVVVELAEIVSGEHVAA